MSPKRITLESLEARYAGFCAAMHGTEDTLRGTYNTDGRVKGHAHE